MCPSHDTTRVWALNAATGHSTHAPRRVECPDAASGLSAALIGVATLAGRWLPVPESADVDRSQLAYWMHESLPFEPDPDAGTVQVVVEYHVRPEQEADWLTAMAAMRASRLRSGAFRWELYRVGERPDHFMDLRRGLLGGAPAPAHRPADRRGSGHRGDRVRYCVTRPTGAHLLPPRSAY